MSSVALKKILQWPSLSTYGFFFLPLGINSQKGKYWIKVLCCVLSLTLDISCFLNKHVCCRHFSKSGCLSDPARCNAKFSRGVQSFSVLLRDKLCIHNCLCSKSDWNWANVCCSGAMQAWARFFISKPRFPMCKMGPHLVPALLSCHKNSKHSENDVCCKKTCWWRDGQSAWDHRGIED